MGVIDVDGNFVDSMIIFDVIINGSIIFVVLIVEILLFVEVVDISFNIESV